MSESESKIKRSRLSLLLAILLIPGLLLIARLFQIQILLHDHYSALASDQHENRIKLELPRGRIFDRRGVVLAMDMPRSYSFGVHPKKIRNPQNLALTLARATGGSGSYYRNKLNSKASFIWIARQLDVERAVSLMNIEGLIKKCESRRFYPFGKNTPKAVGFTDRDGKGIAGVEKTSNQSLASVPGWEITLADAFGKQLENPVFSKQDPIPGADLTLTFDNIIQEITSEELKSTLLQYNAKGGLAIVMLPRTGEILAMSSIPDFDPNYPGEYDDGKRRERNVVDIFEPGSTFKIVPALAALNKGMKLSRLIDCGNGQYVVGEHTIKDIHPHKMLTFEEVIVKSSNVGIARISRWVGAENLYRTARDLGFATYTGIDIPGEARGILSSPCDWDKYMLATIGIGQGVSVTALQLACAYSAIANEGILLKPQIVRSIVTPEGEIHKFQPIPVRRAAKKNLAQRLTEVLVKVVEEGTGKPAAIPGLKIAGKTGTAQKPLTEGKGYSEDKFIASFVGFSVDEPRVLCLVAIDEPQNDHYGSLVAAPVFKRIMEKVLPLVAAENNHFQGPAEPPKREGRFCETPNLLNLPRSEARKFLTESNIASRIVGEGDKVTGQFPLPGGLLTNGDTLTVYTENSKSNFEIKGKNARTAAKELISAGYKVKIVGSGIVESYQFSGKSCTLFCESKKKGASKT